MYCANCGMRLPDWAHYCERCGARVKRAATADDPMDQIGLDDTSASEPLWVEEAPEHVPVGRHALAQERAATNLPTVLMNIAAEGDEDAITASEEAAEPEADHEVKEGSHFAAKEEQGGDDVVPDELTRPMELEELAAAELAQGDEAEQDVEDVPVSDAESLDESESDDARVDDEVDEASEASLSEPEEVPAQESPHVAESRNVQAATEATPIVYAHRQDTWQGRRRPSERMAQSQRTLPMTLVAAVAAVAILSGFAVAFMVLGRGTRPSQNDDAPAITAEHVSKREAKGVIAGLEGWWTTDRTFDGRYWCVADGVMQTYAADGNLTREQEMDPSSVERLSEGPGGIEGAGYYLRDVAFYLLDSDQDTLYAINSDGSADGDANLHRTDDPRFGEEPEPVEEDVYEDPYADDFILPDSSRRLYETSELEPLSDYDLYVAYNELYARHGYVFKSGGDLEQRFTAMSWYKPNPNASWNDLTPIEQQNASTIKALQRARNSIYA